jgi:tagatose-1,6-bisphosphate aldolase
MNKMTTAEYRGYQQICGKDGAMMVVACDQRGAMRQLLADTEEARAGISNDDLGAVKGDIVSCLANHASSVLLDPACAVPRVVDRAELARDVALIIGLDASGYDVSPEGYRLSRLVEGISARKVRDLGGTAGKIMIYLRADTPAANDANLAILRHCIEDFAQENLLLVVEFLTYQLPDESKEDYQKAIPGLIVEGSRLCLDCGSKVLKIPYPGTAEACAKVTEIAGSVPWAVLSAGVDHTTFLGQVEIAMTNGASGVIAGRSLWKDCIALDRDVARDRLTSKALPRLREMQAVVGAHMAARGGNTPLVG